jgi:hypothetical protein
MNVTMLFITTLALINSARRLFPSGANMRGPCVSPQFIEGDYSLLVSPHFSKTFLLRALPGATAEGEAKRFFGFGVEEDCSHAWRETLSRRRQRKKALVRKQTLNRLIYMNTAASTSHNESSLFFKTNETSEP